MISVQKPAQRFIFSAFMALAFIAPTSGTVNAGSTGIGCGVGGTAGTPANPQGVPCQTPPDPGELDDPDTGPNAPKSESSACDANFMNQIYAKAFLEAEREVVVHNALIMKPDSVFEYTCFDQQAADVAIIAGPIFSESTRWSPTTVPINPGSVKIDVNMGDTRLDDGIENLVLESLKIYVDSNFAHDFLGGMATGDNNTISGTMAGISPLPCDFMYLVHDVVRCDAFAPHVQFLSFESYYSTPALLSTDPRTLPVAGGGLTHCPKGHQITSAIVDIANNTNWTYASFDLVDTLLPIQRSPDPGTSGICENAKPIPTGVVISINEKDLDPAGNPVSKHKYEYKDKVCSNPACFFDHGGDSSEGNDKCVP
ncbi:MAG: hypothetical protein R3E13_03680 [Alphaproteobacteria bacterium]